MMIHRLLNRLSLCVAYTTSDAHLSTAAKSTKGLIQASAQRQIVEKKSEKRGIGIVIDNINVMHVPWAKNSRPGMEGRMMNGMAGFMFEMRVERGALDPSKYRLAREKTGRQFLTIDIIKEKMDANSNREQLYLAVHLLSDLIVDVDELSDLLKYLPILAKLLDVEPLELRRTKSVPVPTMARDESRTQDMKGVIDDVTTWLGLSPEQLEETVIVFAGDQLTADRVRQMHRYLRTSLDSSIFETRSFVLPFTGWWHQK